MCKNGREKVPVAAFKIAIKMVRSGKIKCGPVMQLLKLLQLMILLFWMN